MLGAMTDTTSPNVQLVKAAYAAFGRGDINAVVEAMHPEIEWHEAEHSPWHAPGGHHGPTAVLGNVFARIPELFDHFTVDPQAVHDAGATVIVEGRYRAKAAATNESLDAQVCHVWTIRDGKIAEFRQYTDTWQFRVVTSPRSCS
jgi:uncharacterized protein